MNGTRLLTSAPTPLLGVVVLTALSLALPASASEEVNSGLAARTAGSWSMTYHSHWFLIGGLRVAYRLDPQTGLNGLLGQAVVTGCGIQAPRCIQAPALNLGVRRYLTSGSWAPYLGLNLNYLTEGLRFSDHPMLSDLNAGVQAESEGGFIFGTGMSLLSYLDDRQAVGHAVWFHTEIGHAF